MAIFCALCTQPKINLPEDWREYKNRYIIRHFLQEAANTLFQQKHFYVRLYNRWQLPSEAYENEEF